MNGRRKPGQRPGTDRRLDPEAVDRLIDAVQKGGPDRARQLERRAGSEAEAEVVRLVSAIREIGTARVPISESKVDAIVAGVREEAREDSWRSGRLELLFAGIGSGATLWYGLNQLDTIASTTPPNRVAVLLVAIGGALVSLLLQRRVQARRIVPE
ncbi:MAG: hypothetical protein OXI76_01210 [Gemmatimonadota bacterium]|nr:hypothetical protein [Gemmatimonadota bacterium]